MLSQHESEILNDLDQRLPFLSARRFDQRFASQIAKYKKGNIKGKPLEPGYENHCCAAFISAFKVNGSILLQFFDRRLCVRCVAGCVLALLFLFQKTGI